MNKASIETMELGNIIFGNSRGEYHVEPREEYQNIFHEFLENNGFDGYGYKVKSDDRTFENNTFVIRPYYWGDDDDIAVLPNFVYKPMNFEIKWYKYPMRDAYCNIDIDLDIFKQIMKDCEKSLKEKHE